MLVTATVGAADYILPTVITPIIVFTIKKNYNVMRNENLQRELTSSLTVFIYTCTEMRNSCVGFIIHKLINFSVPVYCYVQCVV